MVKKSGDPAKQSLKRHPWLKRAETRLNKVSKGARQKKERRQDYAKLNRLKLKKTNPNTN